MSLLISRLAVPASRALFAPSVARFATRATTGNFARVIRAGTASNKKFMTEAYKGHAGVWKEIDPGEAVLVNLEKLQPPTLVKFSKNGIMKTKTVYRFTENNGFVFPK